MEKEGDREGERERGKKKKFANVNINHIWKMQQANVSMKAT